MKELVTAAEMKSYDSYAIQEIGIPSLVLMERAALGVTAYIREHMQAGGRKVCIVCGVGNNGADGLAIGRLLTEEGFCAEICIFGTPDRGTAEFKVQLQILKSYAVKIVWNELPVEEDHDIIIDSLFGVGLCRPLEGKYAELVDNLNARRGQRLAVDMPSGISADTGQILGTAFRAEHTVTFAFAKRGLYLYPGAAYAGKIHVADIGISAVANPHCRPSMFTYEKKDAERLLPPRDPFGNKGSFGKVLLIAGFEHMAGAAILCARACYEMGAGMVKVLCPEENKLLIQQSVPELLYGTCEEAESSLQWADVVVIGPGLGSSAQARELTRIVLESCSLPLVMDADALNLLAKEPVLQEALLARGERGAETILTPHMGELSRLTKRSVSDLKQDIAAVVTAFAGKHQVILAAKDARTLVAGMGSRVYLNHTGNSGMATAGSGDVLAGMLGALLAQGMHGFDAATLGVFLHSLAGDGAADIYGEYGVTAGKIINSIVTIQSHM